MDPLEQVLASQSYKALAATLAEQSSPVVAVIGAGLSQPAGIPGWLELRQRLATTLLDRTATAEASESVRLQQRAAKLVDAVDPWQSFDGFKGELGEADYRATIRDALSKGDVLEPPGAYQHLWALPIRGILSLNLDSMARRSHSMTHPGLELKSFLGGDAARLPRFVHASHHFLYQLHGTIDDYKSWVFTKTDLDHLYSVPGYLEFLKIVFGTCTALFLGISAQDLAIGSPLTSLRLQGNDGPTHYWLTDRDDAGSREWASAHGIRLISYPGGRHEVVAEVLRRLGSTIPTEEDADPVVIATPNPPDSLPSPEDMIAWPLDELRRALNAHASYLLSQEGGVDLFEAFLDKYEQAVDRAWFVRRNVEGTTLFGYTLQKSNLGGAFGRVYPALDENGELHALKLLRRELQTDLPLLRSYRRGVRAMQILAERGVPGMVAYQQASEIPAFVVMEWIPGPNLSVAKQAHLLEEWEDILWVTVQLCSVIRTAHSLPERVLHRDIRPANVMLRNGWDDRDSWELLVLDFDLSTYKGAEEKSVLADQSVLGYLAPEQIDPSSRFSSRSGLVDSFGIGMTLYFLSGGQEPSANFGRSANYAADVRSATRRPSEPSWRSTSYRVERLILQATDSAQNQRPDVSQMLHEATRLSACLASPESVCDADLLCEELAARCEVLSGKYTWDEDQDRAYFETADGIHVELVGPLEGDEIRLRVRWSARGVERYGDLKSVPRRVDNAQSILQKAGWSTMGNTRGLGVLDIDATIRASALGPAIDASARSIDNALRGLSLG